MRSLVLLVFLGGCFIGGSAHEERLDQFDLDQDDAYDVAFGGEDCDDNDPDIGPAEEEVCDGIDNNCDGQIDEGAGVLGYLDEDGDGYGVGDSMTICGDAEGYATEPGDCDDADAITNPGATEECDNLDNNCDGVVDDGLALTWYADTDGDDFGDPGAVSEFCLEIDGWVNNDGDCNDSFDIDNPDADELCGDERDNDCDGVIDTDAVDTYPIWTDSDGDGFGDGTPTDWCGPLPAGSADADGDCNDADALINPGVEDVCGDFTDNNCSGLVDDGDDGHWFLDEDGDGYGGAALTFDQCDSPGPDFVNAGSDCDDGNVNINPGVPEICNLIDDDCTGVVDDNPPTVTWWADADDDGFGDFAAPATVCDPGAGFVQNTADCDDSNAGANPLASETCADEGVDNDCDGSTTDAPIDPTTWYPDSDGDSYGEVGGATTSSCTAPADHVDENTDCDDSESLVNPDQTEVCNGYDDDCDGDADSDATDKTTHYIDSDGDGYGDLASTIQACGESAGVSADSTDCDDAAGTIYPGATEFCNLLDDDCNGQIDDGAPVPATWYRDDDADGYGDPLLSQESCDPPVGYVLDDRDCDDSASSVNPSMDELCSTGGVDDDCSGLADEVAMAVDTTLYYVDGDSDGYGERGSAAQEACSPPSGWVTDQTDCDDAVNAVNPAASELCSTVGVDDNCSGIADENTASDVQTYYVDGDTDGYGSGSPNTTCTPSGLEVANNTDCNDGDINVNPGEFEWCSTVGIDDNCNGSNDEDTATDVSTWYLDSDGDGFGDSTVSAAACSAPASHVADDTDCDDSEEAAYPGQTSLACDDVSDLNCDTFVDNDADGDGYSREGCGGTDCDDGDTAVNPGAANCDNWLSCYDAYVYGETADGLYDIDPDGVGSNAPFTVYCDMTGGGWTRVFCDDMTTPDPGWNRTTTTCGADTIMGGYDVTSGATINNTIDLLGVDHSLIQVDFDFQQIDSWQNEDGWFEIDGVWQWGESWGTTGGCCSTPGTFDGDNTCGNTDWNHTDNRVVVTVEDSHTATTAFLEWDTDLDQDPDNESYGVDNVCVYVWGGAVTPGGPLGGPTNPGASCLDILIDDASNTTGVYWLDVGNGSFETACEMDYLGGGWTLQAQRRYANSNRENFGSNLGSFFYQYGGNPNSLGLNDSFSADMDNLPTHSDWLFLYYNSSGVLDSDDSHMIDFSGELFPDVSGLQDIAVDGICDVGGASCDTTDGYFKYTRDGYYSSTRCDRTSASDGGYGGAFGYCADNLINESSGREFGDRSRYNEVKLWGHSGDSGDAYMQRIWVR